MIYLFDDNLHGQMSQNYYGIDYIQELPKYSDIIKHISKYQDTEGYGFIKNAQAIFIHDSFPNDTDLNDSYLKSKIVALAKDSKIPYIVFSNGANFTVTVYDDINPNSIKRLKKDRLYYNLLNFLKYFQQNRDSFKIEILTMGKNYKKVKTRIIRDKLSKFLFQKGIYFNYQGDIEENDEHYKLLKELFFFAYNKDFEEEFKKFDEEAYEKKMSGKDFKTHIKNLVNKIIEEDDE